MSEQGTTLSDKIIVWTKEDGSVVITQLIDDSIDIDEEIAKIQLSDPSLTFRAKANLSETGVAINFFYGALAIDEDNNLAYDMVKARDIWRDILRSLRAPKLAELDIAYQRADENGDAELKASIVEKKNILRNCTSMPEIEEAKSLNDLRRTLPPLLAD